jgi:hypothetical protein
MKKPGLESSIDIVPVVCTYHTQLAVCLFLLWLGTANPEQFLSSLPKMFYKIWNFNVRQTANILCKIQLKHFATMKKEVLLRLVVSCEMGWKTKIPFFSRTSSRLVRFSETLKRFSFFAKIIEIFPFSNFFLTFSLNIQQFHKNESFREKKVPVLEIFAHNFPYFCILSRAMWIFRSNVR